MGLSLATWGLRLRALSQFHLGVESLRDASCSEADFDCHFFLWIKAIQFNSEMVWATIVAVVCLFF